MNLQILNRDKNGDYYVIVDDLTVACILGENNTVGNHFGNHVIRIKSKNSFVDLNVGLGDDEVLLEFIYALTRVYNEARGTV